MSLMILKTNKQECFQKVHFKWLTLFKFSRVQTIWNCFCTLMLSIIHVWTKVHIDRFICLCNICSFFFKLMYKYVLCNPLYHLDTINCDFISYLDIIASNIIIQQQVRYIIIMIIQPDRYVYSIRVIILPGLIINTSVNVFQVKLQRMNILSYLTVIFFLCYLPNVISHQNCLLAAFDFSIFCCYPSRQVKFKVREL